MPSLDNPAEFAALADDLHAQRDEVVTARTIVKRLAELVPGADAVSLTIRARGHQHRTLASSADLAAQADALQYQLDEGPCLDATEHEHWVRIGDVTADSRWPRWGPRAGDLGIGSLLSVQLLDEGQPQGALNIYSLATGSFVETDTVDVALVYAVHAAHALSAARLVTNLQTAVSSRHTIGMAQGILMERFGLDQPKSFELLRRLSEQNEMKLRDVAAHVVATRSLPERAGA